MNLEPIRALIKLAGDLENQLYEGDGAYPEDYHDVHTSAVVALPALSQLLEAVTWQPIETAPKDGTHILVCCAGSIDPPTTAHWFEGKWWLSVSYLDAPEEYVWKSPTHWQPLQPNPK